MVTTAPPISGRLATVLTTRPIYRDMRLTHYNGSSFDANDDNLFHWALVRDEVAQDIEIARRSHSQADPSGTAR